MLLRPTSPFRALCSMALAGVLAACGAMVTSPGVSKPAIGSPSPSASLAVTVQPPAPSVSPQATPTPPLMAVGATLRVQVPGVRLRAEPGTSGDLVAALPAGAIVSYIDGPVSGGGLEWYEVRWGRATGWLSSGEDGNWLTTVRNGRIGFACTSCADGGERVTATIEADGSDLRAIHPEYGRPTWSPDGSSVVVEYETGGEFNPQLALMRSDGSDARQLGPGYSPAWSPDGERLAYVHTASGSIVLMDGDADPISITVLDHGARGTLAWSPDSTTLAFSGVDCPTCDPDAPIGGDPPLALFTFQPPGGAVLKVVEGNVGGIRWTPDGSALMYSSHDEATGVTSLSVVEVDTHIVTVLDDLDAGHYGISISPDGSRLVSGSMAGIVVSDLDGSNATVIVPSTTESNPAPRLPRWSPDGRWILYDMDGTEARQVWADAYEASWQPRLEALRP